MTSIKDSVCVITGAGSGIGRELAVQAIQRQAKRVIVTDINGPGLRETEILIQQSGGRLEPHEFDVACTESLGRFVDAVLPSLAGDRLILFNNAGMAICAGRFQDTPLEDFMRVLDVNLTALVRLTKAFYGYLMEHNQGHVVNVSSVFGMAGVDGNAAYCTSKFAVRGFTESLRMELHQSNVNVTCVHPGGIKTNIVRNSTVSGQVITDDHYKQLVQDFDKVAITTASEAARQILQAVERNQMRLVIGRDGKMIDWMTRIFPVAYTKLFIRRFNKQLANPYQD
ncbi:MAG: SDR family NAD(P)-dependent oxidoreductase [Pirellulaceae bacterium]|nr:SDR family NAD(P)-dependent oxidoreductase [Pirellulaceae bacterium]